MKRKAQIRATSKGIKFIDFWVLVANELGQARLHVNPSATSLERFIRVNSDVRTYLHSAIKESYASSGCQHLGSDISLEAVLDILGETAYQLQKDNSGDLFDIELLEEIAWLICDRFANQVRELVKRSEAWQCEQKGNGANAATVISFPSYKIRKANARL